MNHLIDKLMMELSINMKIDQINTILKIICHIIGGTLCSMPIQRVRGTFTMEIKGKNLVFFSFDIL